MCACAYRTQRTTQLRNMEAVLINSKYIKWALERLSIRNGRLSRVNGYATDVLQLVSHNVFYHLQAASCLAFVAFFHQVSVKKSKILLFLT